MKNDFALAFKEILEDKSLPQEVIIDAIQTAIAAAYRRSVNASTSQLIEAEIDFTTGKWEVRVEKEVVEDIFDDRTEVTLSEARNSHPEAQLDDILLVPVSLEKLGRVAAQTARQVITQRIREAERDAQFSYYEKQVGEIISGTVQAITGNVITLGLELKAEGIMPYNQRIPGERVKHHDRIRALLYEVKQTPKGPQIILSRAHRDFLRRLLEHEVPEIYHGLVEIRSIAREPGYRSKVAVSALQPGVDPVGACVGIRGVRIQAIVSELNGEKIDVIEWDGDQATFIARAISPARVSGVFLDEYDVTSNTATVVVPEDQLSLAIGRDGQNARLAAKLTSRRIDIKSLPEATSELLKKLEENPDYSSFAESERETIGRMEISLAKKIEGRPLMPEEYQEMMRFVNRIESSVIKERQERTKARLEKLAEVKNLIPKEAYTLPLATLGLSTKIENLLSTSGFTNVGDLMMELHFNSDSVMNIKGIGAKSFEMINDSLGEMYIKEEDIHIEELVPEVPVEVETLAIETTADIPSEEEVIEAEESLSTEDSAVKTKPIIVDSFEDIFKMKPELLGAPVESPEEEKEEEAKQVPTKTKKKKKKKKPRKFRDVEYDPEKDAMIYKKKRKIDSWEDEWDIKDL